MLSTPSAPRRQRFKATLVVQDPGSVGSGLIRFKVQEKASKMVGSGPIRFKFQDKGIRQ
jgi:hypothetical protein